MQKKLKISVICGGQSTEHEVSLQSAKNVVAALDKEQYDVTVIFITQSGAWYLLENWHDFLTLAPQHFIHHGQSKRITVALGNPERPWVSLDELGNAYPVDCVFPLVHGTNGEDGTLQGLFELLNLAYVGSDAQSSAICMEKDVTKNLLKAAGIAVAPAHVVYPRDELEGLYEQLCAKFGEMLFVKPTSLGSSVGTVPVNSAVSFQQAVKKVFAYDERALVEPRIYGREIECAVLGNENPKASIPGEIVLNSDYYSYEAKYLNPDSAKPVAPAELSEHLVKEIQLIAIRAFKAVHCAGMARIDFFLTADDKILVNEINTIPGFTNISMYPKMWTVSGLSYTQLLDELINLAMARHRYLQSLIRIYQPQ